MYYRKCGCPILEMKMNCLRPYYIDETIEEQNLSYTKEPLDTDPTYVYSENPIKEAFSPQLNDFGPNPFVIDIEDATEDNNNFRLALWTGDHFQLTLMSIGIGEDIGLEVHPNTDQFLRIEEGRGLVLMGDSRDRLNFQRRVESDDAIIIPAGKWHNLVNTGNKPIKLYSIYAPPEHPFGTVHRSKAEAEAAEHQV